MGRGTSSLRAVSQRLKYARPLRGLVVRTYAEAGVSQDEKAAHIAALVSALTYKRSGAGRPLTKIGHFTGLVDFGSYALSLCTDSVGTKTLVAKEMRRWDTIGIDCVAVNVNDMICIGAALANVSIVGGEIAVVPEIVRDLDLAGTCFGVVRKSKIIDGRAIRAGDVIIGLPSTGLHSNGLTLARRLLRDAAITVFDRVRGGGRAWGEELLEPTAIYVRPVLRALRKARIHGMAHVTGGGLRNLARFKRTVAFRITSPLPPPPVFGELQSLGGIEDREMYETYNMGMGFAIVAPEDEAKDVIRALRPDVAAKVVGEVARGRGAVHEPLGLRWESY